MAELINEQDSLNKGRVKINASILASERAEQNSTEALNTANEAKEQSESTQTQLDTIVINGDSSVEAAQARVDENGHAYATLKDRLDTKDRTFAVDLSATKELINKKVDDTILFIHTLKNASNGILIGDSITVGFDAIGGGPDPSNRIIFDNGTNVYHEGNYEADAWANYLRRYATRINPSVDIINAGINGSTIKFANEYKEYRLPESHYDFILIHLGTNDFHKGSTAEEFIENYTKFVQYAKSKSELIICVSPFPRIDAITGLFTMSECEEMIRDISYAEKCIFVPMYKILLDYFDSSAANIIKFMDSDGIHPNDDGHLLIWKQFQQFFKITDAQSEYRLKGQNATVKATLTYQNNWSNRNNTIGEVSKTGNLINVNFSITGGLVTRSNNLFVLPEEFFPRNVVEVGMTAANSTGTESFPAFGYINTIGECKLGINIPYNNILIGNFSFTQ